MSDIKNYVTGKQTLVATSLNHAKTIVPQKACREYVRLRSMSYNIREASGIVIKKEPTILFENNSACSVQLKEGYIKSDITKHISPSFFSYIQKLEKNQEIDIDFVWSCNNPADLFTKTLPTTTFQKHFYNIGIKALSIFSRKRLRHCTLFLL